MLWGEYLAAANADPTIAEALTSLLARRHQDLSAVIKQFLTHGMTSNVGNADGADA